MWRCESDWMVMSHRSIRSFSLFLFFSFLHLRVVFRSSRSNKTRYENRKRNTTKQTTILFSSHRAMNLVSRIIPGALTNGNKDAIDWSYQGLIAYGCQSTVVVLDPQSFRVKPSSLTFLSSGGFLRPQIVQCMEKHHEPIVKVRRRRRNEFSRASSFRSNGLPNIFITISTIPIKSNWPVPIHREIFAFGTFTKRRFSRNFAMERARLQVRRVEAFFVELFVSPAFRSALVFV